MLLRIGCKITVKNFEHYTLDSQPLSNLICGSGTGNVFTLKKSRVFK